MCNLLPSGNANVFSTLSLCLIPITVDFGYIRSMIVHDMISGLYLCFYLKLTSQLVVLTEFFVIRGTVSLEL